MKINKAAMIYSNVYFTFSLKIWHDFYVSAFLITDGLVVLSLSKAYTFSTIEVSRTRARVLLKIDTSHIQSKYIKLWYTCFIILFEPALDLKVEHIKLQQSAHHSRMLVFMIPYLPEIF